MDRQCFRTLFEGLSEVSRRRSRMCVANAGVLPAAGLELGMTPRRKASGKQERNPYPKTKELLLPRKDLPALLA